MSASSEPVHVGLEDEVERGGLARLDLLEDVLELGAAAATPRRRRAGLQPLALLAGLGDGLGRLARRARRGTRRRRRAPSDRPSTCTGVDGPASLTCSPLSSMSARTRPQAAPATIGSPTLSVPVVDEHGGDRAPADVEVGLEHDALGPARRGWRVSSSTLGDDEQLLEQVVDAEVLQRRHLDHDRVAAPRLGHEALLGELLHAPGAGRRCRGRSC